MSREHPRNEHRTARRSKTGCAQCKRRRVKCDEKHPICGQCERSGRECTITDGLFRPHELSFQTSADSQPIPSFVNSSGNVTYPNADTTEPNHQRRHGLNFSVPDFPGQQRDSVDDREVALPLTQQNLQAAAPVERPSGTGGSPWGENYRYAPVQSPSTDLRTVDGSTVTTSEKLEESFFLRCFSERLAPWLDIVNFQRYFGHECIVLLREHSLLRYGACALAAKQLGRSARPMSQLFQNAAQRSIAQQLLSGNHDFVWYGVKYYDKAIKTLARSIRSNDLQQTSFTSPDVTSPTGSLPQSEIMTRAEGEDPIVRLLATCLLIQYENLSGSKKGWTGHLNGFNKLLALLDDGSLFYTNALSQQVFDAKSQRALRAAFWWWVINDLEESFVYRRKARVDPSNISLWRHMGLHINDDETLIDLDVSSTPEAPPHLTGDLQSFALVRLLVKLINEIAISEQQQGPTPTVKPLRMMHNLQQEFEEWYRNSSPGFRADSILAVTTLNGEINNDDPFGLETWYSHEFRAVTMLYYHFGRMLIKIHSPPPNFVESGSGTGGVHSFDLLLALRSIEQQLKHHSQQIIAIVNGAQEQGAVRVRALQPLYVIGRTATTTTERRQLIQMIRSIQDELGLACEYRVKHLLEEWRVSLEALGLDSRDQDSVDSQ